MPRSVKNAKIACLDFSLQKAKMKMGVQVLVRISSNETPIKNIFEMMHFFTFPPGHRSRRAGENT